MVARREEVEEGAAQLIGGHRLGHSAREPTEGGTLAVVGRRSSAQASDVHEWISFEDPTEDRTWLIDATYMRSSHRCIYGEGCKGVLDADATEMQQGCCSYGAHFVDDDDVQTVVRAFVKLQPHHMQFHGEATRDGFLEPGEPDDEGAPTTVTRQVDDACIFLNRPGFDGGTGCALHIAAMAAGERPLDWKPNVCWQVPIRLEHETDGTGHVTSRLREWKRRDWGDGGSEFHWWCTEAPEAFTGTDPVYIASADEIIELVGREIYDLMVSQLTRPTWVPLPHPTVRGR